MKPRITKGFGGFTPEMYAEMAAAVNWLNANASALQRLVNEEPHIRRAMESYEITALITALAKESGKAVWNYGWTQARYSSEATAYEAATGGLSAGAADPMKARNRLEAANTSILAFGYEVSDTVLVDHDGFTIKPVPVGTVVRLTISRSLEGEVWCEFESPNPIDGECPEFIAPEEEAWDFDEGGPSTVYAVGTLELEEGGP